MSHRACRRISSAAAVPLLAVLFAATPAGAQCRDTGAPLPMTLTIFRAEAVDDPEGCCGGAPELYVEVLVNGIQTCTLGPRGSSFKLEGPLTCSFNLPPPYLPVDVELRLMDEDGGAGFADDHLALSPAAGFDLNFTYDPECNRISDDDDPGEVPGCPVGTTSDTCTGSERTIQGNGGADGRGKITFGIAPTDGMSAVNDDLVVRSLEIIQVTPNPDAVVDDKATIVRVTVSSTHAADANTTLIVHSIDELGNPFHDERTITVPGCGITVEDMYRPGWDGGATRGFRPQAGPVTPPGHLDVVAGVDIGHVVDPCETTSCLDECKILDNYDRNDRIPVKVMKDLSVLFQPLSETQNCQPSTGGEGVDAQVTRDAATPYMRELYPAQTLTTDWTNEVMAFMPPAASPHVTLAMLHLFGNLNLGFDRIAGIVKDGYFQCHYAAPWSAASGASLGDYGRRLVIGESPSAAPSSEVMAHEIAHTFGLTESECPLDWPASIFSCEDEYNWCGTAAGAQICPTTSGRLTRGFRISTGASMDGAVCLMGTSNPDDATNPDQWLCDVDYNALIARLKDEPDPEVLWLRLHFGKGRVGSFYKDDASRIPNGVPDILSENGGGQPDPSNDTTSLVFKDAAGAVLDRVHFTPESIDTDDDGRDDSFGIPDVAAPQSGVDMALVVALPAGTASIDLLRRECVGGMTEDCVGGVVAGSTTDSFFVPPGVPDISLLQPLSSLLVNPGDLIPIEWQNLGTFANFASSTLSYVMVSPDDGAHWIPIAGRVAGTQYTWQSRSAGRYWVRVFTTNGFNTDDARGETDTDRDGCGNSRDPHPTSADPDGDGDGIANPCDNCLTVRNPVQQNHDADAYGDSCDNCPTVTNSDQLDSDGDQHGNACDCAPTASTTWAIPVEATGLTVAKPATGGNVTVSWSSLATQAGTSIRYDLLTGTIGSLRSTGGFTGASCFANDQTTTSFTGTQTWPPSSGSYGYWYLARGQNPCGKGTYGNATPVPDPRDPLDGTGSPCP